MKHCERSFNVAIVGGGIAGATLAVALLKHKVPVTIYESAAQFGEIGAGVALGANAARAMELISADVKRGFDRVGTFNLSTNKKNVWFDFRRGVGAKGGHANEDQGRLITTVETPSGSAYVHRADFLDELVKLIPQSVTHFGKRLQDIETLSDCNVKLLFTDGTSAVHSAVIGCDGIKSRTRQVILGDNDPAAHAVFSGKYAYRGLIPMDKAAALLGDELARNSQMYLGYHGHVLTFPIKHGDIMNGKCRMAEQDGYCSNTNLYVEMCCQSSRSQARTSGRTRAGSSTRPRKIWRMTSRGGRSMCATSYP